MKPYGADYEPALDRIQPDVADTLYLGMPSRYHKMSSSMRQRSRRVWKKKMRAAGRQEIASVLKSEDR